MAESAPIVSGPLTAASNTVGSYQPAVNGTTLTIYNRTGAGEVFFVVGPSSLAAPTVAGANEWYLPAVAGAVVEINVTQLWNQGEQPETPLVVQAISASALSLWVEVNQ